MNKTTRTILWIVIAVVVIGGIWYTTTKEQSVEEDVVKIGAILPLTGEVAIVGISIQQGIEIAVEDVNKIGGIKGRQIKVVFENDEYDNKKSVTASQKLINVDKIDIGIMPFVHGAKAVMPIFEQNKIPLIVAWDSTNELEKGDYIFSTGFSTELSGKRMANYAYNELNLRKVAIVLHQDEWSEVIAPAFKEEFQGLGGKVLLEEKVTVGESDFRTIISKIKSKGADAVYLPLVPMNTDMFLKQAKELGLEAQILSGDALIPDIIMVAGEAAEGVYFTSIYVEDNEISRDLDKKYREKYGEEAPALPMVAFGYDAMLAIKSAIEKVEEITPEGIKDVFYSIDIIGAGGQIKIGVNGLSERVEKVFRVQNGEGILVE
ncbi:penicillin-binding protein activator [Patescibacteria group bacterium]|nr:penicillin-binding protein activator [Patescibacteria group bacterium]